MTDSKPAKWWKAIQNYSLKPQLRHKIMGLLLLSVFSSLLLVSLLIIALTGFSVLSDNADRTARLSHATSKMKESQEHFHRNVNVDASTLASKKFEEVMEILEEISKAPSFINIFLSQQIEWNRYRGPLILLMDEYHEIFQEMIINTLQLRGQLDLQEALVTTTVSQIRNEIIKQVRSRRLTSLMANKLVDVNEGALAYSCYVLLDQLNESQHAVNSLLLNPKPETYVIKRSNIEAAITKELERIHYLLLAIQDDSLIAAVSVMRRNIENYRLLTLSVEEGWMAKMQSASDLNRANDYLLKTIGNIEKENSAHFHLMKSRVMISSVYLGLVAITLILFLGLLLTRSVIKSLNHSVEALTQMDLDMLDSPLVSVETHENELTKIMAAVDDLRLRLLEGIRQRQKQELALEESEENLRITLDSIGDGVIAVDTESRITSMNPVAEQLTGWKKEEAVSLNLAEIYCITEPSNITKQGDKNGLEQYSLPRYQILQARDDSEYLISSSRAPIRSRGGDIRGGVIVFRDITNEISLQEQLLHNTKMDAIGQLAGGVAHDFNNMLSGIMGASELLRYIIPDNSSALNYLEMITGAVERAAGLTQKLLAFARKQPPVSSIIDVHETLADTVALLENTFDKGIRINISLAAERSCIVGDPAQLQNVFVNLCINSSHAMPNGGTININTSCTQLDENFCKTYSPKISSGTFVKIELNDSGTGIAPEHLAKIFEPFFTTKAEGKGTGLGLAMVQETIRNHNGVITVSSKLGNGTIFDIYLPTSTGGVEVDQVIPQTISGTGNILIIDDEAVSRKTAGAILEKLGYSVCSAENGHQGLEKFSIRPEDIDLVILDLIMPEMDGKACFAEIKAIRPEMKILLTSGFSNEDDIAEMKGNGLSGFIQKPFRSADLSQIVHDIISK